MRRINIIAAGTMTLALLASCEMKEELWGSSDNNKETGSVELTVSTRRPADMTRVLNEETKDFPVKIAGKENSETADVVREFSTVASMTSAVILPVGEYVIYSHTPGDIAKQMPSPYYDGNATLTISKGITSSIEVVCKMKNSRIQMQYGDDFKAAFQSWTITIDDGNNSVLSYTEAAGNDGATPIYWYFEEEKVNAIKVNIRAKTKEGNTVSESRIFKKSDASESYENISDFFGGGDAVVIKMGAIAASSGYVTGITINTDISFEDVNGETVTIPVDGENIIITPDPEPEPEPDPTGDLTLTFTPTEITFSANASDATLDNLTANANIRAKSGIKSMIVKINAGNDGFLEALQAFQTRSDDDGGPIDFINGEELVNNTKVNELFESLGKNLKCPVANVTEYTFPIGDFWTLLNITGKTDAGKAHEFVITVTDNDGNKITTNNVFKVYITE